MGSRRRRRGFGRVGGYRKRAPLASAGRWGTVYLATRRGRRFALKEFHRNLDPAYAGRLRREVDAASRVDSPYVARVIAFNTDSEPYYIVYEFVEGDTLHDRVAKAGALRGDELLKFTWDLANAVSAIHGAGVAHRDLNPTNVILGHDATRVVDFGLAASDVTTARTILQPGASLATPVSVSPEQAAGLPSGMPTDVFAWAVLTLFAARGEPPFGSGSISDVMQRIQSQEPRLDGTEPALHHSLLTALVKDPGVRPDATKVVAELRSSLPTRITDHREPRRSYAPSGRRSTIRTAGVYVLVALLPAVAAGVVVAHRQNSHDLRSASLSVFTDPSVPSALLVDGRPVGRYGWSGSVTAGGHWVCFSPVQDMIEPPCQLVSVAAGGRSVITGGFALGQRGSTARRSVTDSSFLLSFGVTPREQHPTVCVDGLPIAIGSATVRLPAPPGATYRVDFARIRTLTPPSVRVRVDELDPTSPQVASADYSALGGTPPSATDRSAVVGCG